MGIDSLALKYASRATDSSNELPTIKRYLELAYSMNESSHMVRAANLALQHPQIIQKTNRELRKLAHRHKANGIYSQLHAAESVSTYTWRELAEHLQTTIKIDALYPQHAFRLALILRNRIEQNRVMFVTKKQIQSWTKCSG